MATNEPFVPSMIVRCRTTTALSNVTEQKACNRSLFSSTSLMRTSVMTTAVLLCTRGYSAGYRLTAFGLNAVGGLDFRADSRSRGPKADSDATSHQEHARPGLIRTPPS